LLLRESPLREERFVKKKLRLLKNFCFLLQKILLLGSCFRDMASSCIRQVCFF
jgi:hypothetical protein